MLDTIQDLLLEAAIDGTIDADTYLDLFAQIIDCHDNIALALKTVSSALNIDLS